jgi:hypothetical protein
MRWHAFATETPFWKSLCESRLLETKCSTMVSYKMSTSIPVGCSFPAAMNRDSSLEVKEGKLMNASHYEKKMNVWYMGPVNVIIVLVSK